MRSPRPRGVVHKFNGRRIPPRRPKQVHGIAVDGVGDEAVSEFFGRVEGYRREIESSTDFIG